MMCRNGYRKLLGPEIIAAKRKKGKVVMAEVERG